MPSGLILKVYQKFLASPRENNHTGRKEQSKSERGENQEEETMRPRCNCTCEPSG